VFFGSYLLFWGRGLTTLRLFLYATKEAGRKFVWNMPWPPAAKCNMISNEETNHGVITQKFWVLNEQQQAFA